MKVKELKKALENVDDDLDVEAYDGICIYDVTEGNITSLTSEQTGVEREVFLIEVR